MLRINLVQTLPPADGISSLKSEGGTGDGILWRASYGAQFLNVFRGEGAILLELITVEPVPQHHGLNKHYNLGADSLLPRGD